MKMKLAHYRARGRQQCGLRSKHSAVLRIVVDRARWSRGQQGSHLHEITQQLSTNGARDTEIAFQKLVRDLRRVIPPGAQGWWALLSASLIRGIVTRR